MPHAAPIPPQRTPSRARRATTRAKTARPDDDAPLARYRAKRDFTITSEPGPAHAPSSDGPSFVIQKHDATRLHYDFRLELDGVLLSWAVPKGPSLDPKEKRLAVHVEDHPVAYGGFEGTIPKGQYGAGDVIVWDNGRWEPVGDARAGLKAGKLVFRLHGHKLAGLWELVRIAKPGERQEPWLLFKKHDEWERPHAAYDVVAALPDSVIAKPLPLLEGPATRAAKTSAPFDAGALAGAATSALPATLAPQLATLAKTPPTHGEWLYEIKFDGYRLLTRIEKAHAAIFTRGGHDWTHKLGTLAAELAALGLDDAWLDGEAVVLGEDDRPHFNLLQNALDGTRGDAVVYYLFDIPFANGHDLRGVALQDRRALLKRIVDAHAGDRIRFSDDFPAGAAEVLESACAMRLEGVIAKRKDSAYTCARSTDWLKLKCAARQEFVIAGFSDRSDNAKAVGALSLGYFDPGGVLQYAGRVGTGWSADEAVALRTRLARLVTTRPPLPAGTARSTRWKTRPAARDHWVRPSLVAEIRFAEWTPDGSVRHASYQGLREDRDARSVGREVATPPPKGAKPAAPAKRKSAAGTAAGSGPERSPAAKSAMIRTSAKSGAADVEGVRITHPERVVDAASGHTKLELARYYAGIAEWMLPHLKSRPASLVRAPAGVGGELFFQKHADARTMPGVKQLEGLWEGHAPLLEVPSAKALVAAAQMNVIEFHTWNSVKQKIARPDRMVFDLDPGEGVAFAAVREGAQLMRALLDELGLASWLKTSGGKGLHVVVPLSPRLDYDTVKDFSRAAVQHLADAIPQRFVAKSGPSNRVGRIFVDYLRNGFNATTAAAFSARARPGLGVSMPVAWDELPELASGAQWTISDARDRLAFQKVDPWAGYWTCRQTLTAALKSLAKA